MRIGNSYKEKEATKESLSLEASVSVDPALRASLTDEDGLLRPGALPKIATASAQGNKAILDSMDKAGHWGWSAGLTQYLETTKIVHINRHIVYIATIGLFLAGARNSRSGCGSPKEKERRGDSKSGGAPNFGAESF